MMSALTMERAVEYTRTWVRNLRSDPTRTLNIRNAWSREVERRFRAVMDVVRITVVDLDFFAYGPPSLVLASAASPASPPGDRRAGVNASPFWEQIGLSPLQPGQWRYRNDEAKMRAFMEWLSQMNELGILQVTTLPGAGLGGVPHHWQNTYIRSSYQGGLEDGWRKLEDDSIARPPYSLTETGLDAAFYQPFHADRVATIYGRAYRDLRGVTTAMEAAISRELALGIAKGEGPYSTARKLAKALEEQGDKIGITRARLIARTETVRAHNIGNLSSYEEAEAITGVPTKVIWETAGDDRVRPHHAMRHGVVYKRSEAAGLLGEPNCRCALLPYQVGNENSEDRRLRLLDERKRVLKEHGIKDNLPKKAYTRVKGNADPQKVQGRSVMKEVKK